MITHRRIHLGGNSINQNIKKLLQTNVVKDVDDVIIKTNKPSSTGKSLWESSTGLR